MNTEPGKQPHRENPTDEQVAQKLRSDLGRTGTLMANLIGPPGAGKTALLELTVQKLKRTFRLAVIEGDVASDRDSERICRLGVAARQILTGGSCHLEPHQIEYELRTLGSRTPEIVFVENVGDLICPVAYDLGEDFKVALFSVVGGDQVPFKYPQAFAEADITLITKADLLPVVAFDVDRVRDQLARLNPDARVLVTSAVTGDGVDAWCRFLERRLMRKRPRSPGEFVTVDRDDQPA
jgi:hydrogenase nickel incorporation protein HypB